MGLDDWPKLVSKRLEEVETGADTGNVSQLPNICLLKPLQLNFFLHPWSLPLSLLGVKCCALWGVLRIFSVLAWIGRGRKNDSGL